MSSILEEFAYGNLMPQEQVFNSNSKYKEAAELLIQLEGKLMERLDADGKELFEKYMTVEGEVGHMIETENFVHGYRLGLIMTAEAFMGTEALCGRREI